MATNETKTRAPRSTPEPDGEGRVEPLGKGTRMALFIAGLVLNQDKLQYFVKNPESRRVMMDPDSSGLTEEEIGLMTTPCFVAMCDHLVKAGVGPGPPDEPPVEPPPPP